MALSIGHEISTMQRMTVKELQAKYLELFGDQTHTGNKVWLIKRIAWRLQAINEGELTERARRRAAELANDADLRTTVPRTYRPRQVPQHVVTLDVSRPSAQRLPPPGSELVREYKGRRCVVLVLPMGFEYLGQTYRSLSAVAKAITGSHVNGFQFFRLGQGGHT